MRLRPSGKAGLLITSIDAFADYQRHEAWTLEHQALLHARAVAGAPALRQQFEERAARGAGARSAARAPARGRAAHAQRACAASCRGPSAGEFDLKQDAGRHRRHRVPGAVLGAAAGRSDYPPVAFTPTPSASSSRWPRQICATGAGRRADRHLSHLSHAPASSRARRSRGGRASDGIRGRARRRDARSGIRVMGEQATGSSSRGPRLTGLRVGGYNCATSSISANRVPPRPSSSTP